MGDEDSKVCLTVKSRAGVGWSLGWNGWRGTEGGRGWVGVGCPREMAQWSRALAVLAKDTHRFTPWLTTIKKFSQAVRVS